MSENIRFWGQVRPKWAINPVRRDKLLESRKYSWTSGPKTDSLLDIWCIVMARI